MSTQAKQDIRTIVDQIQREGAEHSNDERFVRTIETNQSVRQGDVYLTRVPDNHRRGLATTDRQLAPGTSKGSRHVVADQQGVSLFKPADETDPLAGPIVVAEQRFRVTHPEHADFSLPSGTYQVGYQLDPRTRRRVAD